MFNKGGQRRTIQAPCGWTAVGHPREVNGKYNIHRRFCEICKDCESEVPEFNKANGNYNGWKGISNRNHTGKGTISNQFISEAVCNGESFMVHTSGTSLDAAMKNIEEYGELITEIADPEPKTDKKKRKKNKKAKKPIHLEKMGEDMMIVADGMTEEDIAEFLADLDENK